MVGKRRVAVCAAIVGISACAGSGPAPSTTEDREAPLRAKHAEVQRVACIQASKSWTCEPGLRAAFEASATYGTATIGETDAGIPADQRRRGWVYCEDGRPRGHFENMETPPDTIERDIPAPIWDAIWRVLEASGSCASTYRAPVKVTRGGESTTCADPRFDMHELFEMAHRFARRGPTAETRKVPKESYQKELERKCLDNPAWCWDLVEGQKKCLPFAGPWWPPADESSDGGSDAMLANVFDAGVREASREGPKPSFDAVVAAFTKVRPQAHACLKSGDPYGSARVTFRPDGTVEQVIILFRLAGSHAEPCLKNVFGKMRLPPFPGGESYTAVTTVGPRD